MARNSRRKTTEPALEDLADVTTALIYRAISRSGRHELARPFSALWWSDRPAPRYRMGTGGH
jgi:formate-nitrite transporter family protein